MRREKRARPLRHAKWNRVLELVPGDPRRLRPLSGEPGLAVILSLTRTVNPCSDDTKVALAELLLPANVLALSCFRSTRKRRFVSSWPSEPPASQAIGPSWRRRRQLAPLAVTTINCSIWFTPSRFTCPWSLWVKVPVIDGLCSSYQPIRAGVLTASHQAAVARFQHGAWPRFPELTRRLPHPGATTTRVEPGGTTRGRLERLIGQID